MRLTIIGGIWYGGRGAIITGGGAITIGRGHQGRRIILTPALAPANVSVVISKNASNDSEITNINL